MVVCYSLITITMKASTPIPFELTFDNRREYLYARVTAPDINDVTALEYLAEIADKCAAVRCKRILIDRRIPATVTYEVIKRFVRMSRGLKIAIVNQRCPLTLKRFLEQGAKEGAKASCFTSVRDAEKWLLNH